MVFENRMIIPDRNVNRKRTFPAGNENKKPHDNSEWEWESKSGR